MKKGRGAQKKDREEREGGKKKESTRGKESSREQGRCWTERTRVTKVADNERQMEGVK